MYYKKTTTQQQKNEPYSSNVKEIREIEHNTNDILLTTHNISGSVII